MTYTDNKGMEEQYFQYLLRTSDVTTNNNPLNEFNYYIANEHRRMKIIHTI